MTASEMITPREAMQILGITSRSQFWKIVYSRSVPHYRCPGTRLIRFERAEIEAEKRSWRIETPEDLRRSINGRRLSAQAPARRTQHGKKQG